jgi:hypothetical protein
LQELVSDEEPVSERVDLPFQQDLRVELKMELANREQQAADAAADAAEENDAGEEPKDMGYALLMLAIEENVARENLISIFLWLTRSTRRANVCLPQSFRTLVCILHGLPRGLHTNFFLHS